LKLRACAVKTPNLCRHDRYDLYQATAASPRDDASATHCLLFLMRANWPYRARQSQARHDQSFPDWIELPKRDLAITPFAPRDLASRVIQRKIRVRAVTL
jgi:hypothetical protein